MASHSLARFFDRVQTCFQELLCTRFSVGKDLISRLRDENNLPVAHHQRFFSETSNAMFRDTQE